MDKNFAFFLKKFGEPTLQQLVPAEIIEKFRGILPDELLEYWTAYGFSSFTNGLFSITNPHDYTEILAQWFEGTSVPKNDSLYVIGRNSFGDLYVWSKALGYKYKISPCRGLILEKTGDGDAIQARGIGFAMQLFFGTLSNKNCDITDESGNPLFERAVKKLGPLGKDEVFAFEPAPCAGGQYLLKNIQKRNIHVYLSILLGLCEREYISLSELQRRALG